MTFSNCDEARELLGVYAIGATDSEETRLVEAALVDCPELADELADYAVLTDALHRAVPARFPAPPAARILAGIHQPANHPAEFRDEADEPPPALRMVPRAQPIRTRRWWWVSIAALFVVTLLSVGSNLYWADQVNRLREAVPTQSVPPTPAQPLPVTLKPEDSHHRRLTATAAGQPDAQAQVIWNSDIEVGALYATGLQQLPPDMDYQLWAVRGDEAISLGQFTVDENGTGFLIFQSPQPIVGFDALGISPEPATGSARPTHEHVVVGKI
ncbi:MAG: anti-sigma factor [Anaerolineae bacterium]|nr:anti-sigma factor [Anaerolineae bacterium]